MRSEFSRCLIFCVFLVLVGHSVRSQDLFNYENSRSFADYLFKTKRFEFAISEYNRVVFLVPSDTGSWVNLVKSYQQIGDHPNALKYLTASEKVLGDELPQLGLLRSYTYLKTEKFFYMSRLLNQYSLKNEDRNFILSSTQALSGNWDYFIENPDPGNYWNGSYSEMAQAVTNHKRKSPFVAGTLSALVPGTGKMYAKRWKDGLFSLLLVGATSWQATRLISKNGIDNFGSIFFSGFAAGLYVGNIYGSTKAARDYNVRLRNEYHQKAHQLVDLYFDY